MGSLTEEHKHYSLVPQSLVHGKTQLSQNCPYLRIFMRYRAEFLNSFHYGHPRTQKLAGT